MRRHWSKMPPVLHGFTRAPDGPDGTRLVTCDACGTVLASLGIGYHVGPWKGRHGAQARSCTGRPRLPGGVRRWATGGLRAGQAAIRDGERWLVLGEVEVTRSAGRAVLYGRDAAGFLHGPFPLDRVWAATALPEAAR